MAERILIVDDDIDSLKLIGLMLQRHGYEVLAANAGKQALQKAESERPNLIILDVMMPDMNGLEVCRRLRSNAKTAGIPIIMFTAKTLIDDKVKGFEAGADDYLTKPTHPAELASRVKAILARNVTKSPQTTTPAAARPAGLTIGLIGAKGGVGVTTLAINLAAAYVQASDNPILADLRLGQGTVGLNLGLGRSQGMARILTRPVNEITAETINNEVVTHQSGLRALVSSVRHREAVIDYTVDHARKMITVLREVGRPAIVDLGAGLNRITHELYSEFDRIALVLEPNMVAVQQTQELLRLMEGEGHGQNISIVVINRTQSSLQTSWHEIESTLGREVRAIVSAAPELAYQGLENHMPMVMLQPSAVVSGQFVKLAEELKTKIKTIAGSGPVLS